MEIFKVASKYCIEDKVQLMLKNSDSQIICSKEGYLYLKKDDILIHRYLTDPLREGMPYSDTPTSKEYNTHLFKYNQIYVWFCNELGYDEFGLVGGYSLNFIYFLKTKNNEAIGVIFKLDDFKYEEKSFENMTGLAVEKFLYQHEDEIGKYIFNSFSGIKCAWDKSENLILGNSVVDLSEENILHSHNAYNIPIYLFRTEADEYVTDIKEVENVIISERNGFMGSSTKSNMVIIKENDIIIYNFDIWYCSKNRYKIKADTCLIRIGDDLKKKIMNTKNISYTSDPDLSK